MSQPPSPMPVGGDLIIYQTEDGRTRLQVRLQGETVWLTQAQMAELFQRERSVITKHIRNIFTEGELVESAVCASYAHTAADRKTYQTVYYNLDVIISVGYRVKSRRGTQLRIWATRVLKEHLIRGYSVNKLRLKELRTSLHLSPLMSPGHFFLWSLITLMRSIFLMISTTAVFPSQKRRKGRPFL